MTRMKKQSVEKRRKERKEKIEWPRI
jgi:hypothetical protein